MTRTMMWHAGLFSDYVLSRALGQRGATGQVRIGGAYPSAAAFARALIADGRWHGSVSSATAFIRNYGYGSNPTIPDYVEPGTLYVAPINAPCSVPWRRVDELLKNTGSLS
jgi:hypothetical protein